MENYKKLPNIYRIDTGNTHGWQFRGKFGDDNITQLFSDKKHGGIDAAREKCIDFKNEVFSAFEDEILNDLLVGNIAKNAVSKNGCGITGLCKTYSAKKEKRHYHWQCNYKDSDGNTKYKTRSINKYGEKESFLFVLKFRRVEVAKFIDIATEQTKVKIESLVNEYDELIEFVEDLPADCEEEFFQFLERGDILDTEKMEELKRRIGQEVFRRKVLKYWENKCAVLGVINLVNAGHIKPWRASSDKERLDVYNGIALSPDYDKAFDIGLITFRTDGAIQIASCFKSEAEVLGISEGAKLENINENHFKYIKYHNAHIFVDNVF